MRAATFETICSNDPEIDTEKVEASVFVEYLNTRKDLSVIAHAFTTTGPTRYRIREIPHALWDWVDEPNSDALKYKRAFMAGVESVANLMQSDGSRLGSTSGTSTISVGTGQADVMQEKDLKYFSPAERLEIGAVAYTHSFLHRKIESCFRLPPMCHRTLAEREFRSAAPSPISQDKPSAEPSESEGS